MRVYIANFGKSNWAWAACLKRSALAVMDDERVHPFWQRGDREGYIREAQRVLRLASGGPVIKPVASRWYNLNTILMETVGDIWIHREKNELWWTVSINEKPDVELIEDPQPHAGTNMIFVYYKRCSGWSDQSKKGSLLRWEGLHARAKEFLFTEGTFQQLSDDNAHYATAMINGDDLSAWHLRPEWKRKTDNAKLSPVTYFNSQKKTIVRMAMTAFETARQSGDTSLTTRKEKECRFRNQFEMEKYLEELFAIQDGVCALTGLHMLLDDDDIDPELHCSLDRIDSTGHYERGNLQIVCKFANRWKGASDNEGFLGLINKIQSSSL
jgi:hypothetical protein